MRKQLSRKQMIALIASDFGYGPETTINLKTEILRDVCNSPTPFLYLQSFLEAGSKKN